MFEPYEIAERIKLCAKEKNITVKSLLQDAGVGEKMVSNMSGKNGSYPQSDKIAQIAKVLNCSVDYLLGRTDNPEITGGAYINGNNNGIQAVSHDNSKLTVNGNTKSSTDTDELMELIQDLPLVKRAEAVLYINELKKKKEEE